MTRLAVAALLVVAVHSMVGCGAVGRQLGQSPSASGVATESVTPTASVGASEGVPAGSGTGAATTRKGLSASDAQAIDAELDAVGRELERLDMPTDGDFDDISKGLE